MQIDSQPYVQLTFSDFETSWNLIRTACIENKSRKWCRSIFFRFRHTKATLFKRHFECIVFGRYKVIVRGSEKLYSKMSEKCGLETEVQLVTQSAVMHLYKCMPAFCNCHQINVRNAHFNPRQQGVYAKISQNKGDWNLVPRGLTRMC